MRASIAERKIKIKHVIISIIYFLFRSNGAETSGKTFYQDLSNDFPAAFMPETRVKLFWVFYPFKEAATLLPTKNLQTPQLCRKD